MSRTCGAWNGATRTQCSRGKIHVENKMCHADNQGNQWPLSEETGASARAEFIEALRQAIRQRMLRARQFNAADAEELLDSLPEIFRTTLASEKTRFRRLNK